MAVLAEPNISADSIAVIPLDPQTARLSAEEELLYVLQAQARHHLLTQKQSEFSFEEKRTIHLGDRAIQALLADNERVIHSLVRRGFHASSQEYEELLQQAHLAFEQALYRFDPSRNTRLTTWIYWSVRKAVFRTTPQRTELDRKAETLETLADMPPVEPEEAFGSFLERLSETYSQFAGNGEAILDRLKGAITCLGEEARALLEGYFGGKSYQQLAEEFAISSRDAVRMRLSRLYKKLLSLMLGNSPEPPNPVAPETPDVAPAGSETEPMVESQPVPSGGSALFNAQRTAVVPGVVTVRVIGRSNRCHLPKRPIVRFQSDPGITAIATTLPIIHPQRFMENHLPSRKSFDWTYRLLSLPTLALLAAVDLLWLHSPLIALCLSMAGIARLVGTAKTRNTVKRRTHLLAGLSGVAAIAYMRPSFAAPGNGGTCSGGIFAGLMKALIDVATSAGLADVSTDLCNMNTIATVIVAIIAIGLFIYGVVQYGRNGDFSSAFVPFGIVMLIIVGSAVISKLFMNGLQPTFGRL